MAHRGISHGLSRSPDRAETENTLLLMPVSYVLECLTVYLHPSSPSPPLRYSSSTARRTKGHGSKIKLQKGIKERVVQTTRNNG